jgi:hypothetical protein
MTEAAICLVSYPKTGRTWLRALIGKSLCLKYRLAESRILDTEFLTAAAGLPVTTFTHDNAGMRQRRHYSRLNPDKSEYREKKVLLLGRDIRDTLVSAYFQATRRIGVFEGPISEFIRSEKYGAIKILTFYRQWHEARRVPMDFLFIRYEDMHRDTAGVLRKALDFLAPGIAEPGIMNAAIEYSSFENLRKAEAENRFGTSILSPADAADPDSFKVRRGQPRKFGEYLGAEDVAWINQLNSEIGCEFTRIDASDAGAGNAG